MNVNAIFAERDIQRATSLLSQLERYAERRNNFLDALDFDQLDPDQAYAIIVADEEIEETLAYAQLYLIHLVDIEAHRPQLKLAA